MAGGGRLAQEPCREHGRALSASPHLQERSEPAPWLCPFHPPLQLFFVLHNSWRLPSFRLARIKVWNYWTASGSDPLTGHAQVHLPA